LNVFAIERATDELADASGTDPLAFRLRHLADPRGRAVLEAVAVMCRWPAEQAAGEGRAMGLAVARYKNKGAWLAAVAEVAVDEEIRVERLWLAADCGRLINPQGALSQIEGGALQAVSWTLKEAVPIEDGRIPPLDWSDYPILRFSEVPVVETRFIAPAGAPPLGAGEAAQGPVSAAIGNAASRALGLQMRD
ncbi:molybdopterin-dependent oxidoreductase, partial [Rhizobium sp. TRM95111]|uniref:molybdopterin cofactor-binding domain-containing protein n=1 Tax=Rhizobium alarense TaxID=2846851 RepID=UPI001F288616